MRLLVRSVRSVPRQQAADAAASARTNVMVGSVHRGPELGAVVVRGVRGRRMRAQGPDAALASPRRQGGGRGHRASRVSLERVS